MFNRNLELHCLQDNEATIKVVHNGFSAKMRHILRTHKVDLGSLGEQFEPGKNIYLEYVNTKEQAADVFTKNLQPASWPAAVKMLAVCADDKVKELVKRYAG